MPLVINDQRVEDAVLDAEFIEIKSYYERLGNVSCCERDPEFRGYARDNIIARVLLIQEARRTLPPRPQAEVDDAIAKLQEAHGGEASFYSAVGGTPEQMALVRQDVELDLRARKMVDDRVRGLADPTDAHLVSYYQSHLETFMTDERVRASHILKAPKRGEDRVAAFEELRAIRRKLLLGADFDDLARQHSDKADEHIDLGFFKRGELPEEFETVAFSMNIGEISPVFGSPYGFHLMKVTDHQPAVAKPFEEVRAEVLERLKEERRQQQTRQLVEQLKSSAIIEDLASFQEAPAHVHAAT